MRAGVRGSLERAPDVAGLSASLRPAGRRGRGAPRYLSASAHGDAIPQGRRLTAGCDDFLRVCDQAVGADHAPSETRWWAG
jgi:hypothetical protein